MDELETLLILKNGRGVDLEDKTPYACIVCFVLLRSPQKDSLVYEESKKTVEFEADGR
jgi:hypothetical protein